MTNPKRRADSLTYLVIGFTFLLIGAFIFYSVASSMNSCKMDVPERTTRIKEKIEKVCLDALPGTKEVFSGSTCPSRYEIMAASCDDLTWRMAFREARTVFYGRPFGFTWFSPQTGNPPGSPSPAFSSGYLDSGAMQKIIENAAKLDDPESILVQVAKNAPSLPLATLQNFAKNSLPAVISSEKLAKVPVGFDKTVVISGLDQSDFTPAMVGSVIAAEEINSLWKNEIAKKLVGIYTFLGMQVYGSVTFGPKNAPAASYVITSVPGVTLQPEKARHLANAYFQYLIKYGTADAAAIARSENATVWNSADPWASLLEVSNRVSLVPCVPPASDGSGGFETDFCSTHASLNDLLNSLEAGLGKIRVSYDSVKSARSDVVSLLYARSSAGKCSLLSDPPYTIPTCAAMISCNWVDRKLTEGIQKNGCLMNAFNLEGPPEALPLGVMQREAALEVWDINLPEGTSSKVSGDYSYRPVMNCPSIIPGSHLPAWGGQAEKYVVVCTHDTNSNCAKDNTCYYCYTIQCANKVTVNTEPATQITVENIARVGTQINGSVYRLR
jgi:hypothetical protein